MANEDKVSGSMRLISNIEDLRRSITNAQMSHLSNASVGQFSTPTNLDFEVILNELLNSLTSLLIKYKSAGTSHDLVSILEHVKARANESVEEEISRFENKLNAMRGPDPMNRLSAVHLLSRELSNEISNLLFKRNSDHTSRYEELQHFLKTMLVEQETNSKTILQLNAKIDSHQQEKRDHLLAIKDLQSKIGELNRELASVKHISNLTQLSIKSYEDQKAALLIMGAEYKTEVDRQSDNIQHSVLTRMGFLPPDIERQISVLKLLKPPIDSKQVTSDRPAAEKEQNNITLGSNNVDHGTLSSLSPFKERVVYVSRSTTNEKSSSPSTSVSRGRSRSMSVPRECNLSRSTTRSTSPSYPSYSKFSAHLLEKEKKEKEKSSEMKVFTDKECHRGRSWDLKHRGRDEDRSRDGEFKKLTEENQKENENENETVVEVIESSSSKTPIIVREAMIQTDESNDPMFEGESNLRSSSSISNSFRHHYRLLKSANLINKHISKPILSNCKLQALYQGDSSYLSYSYLSGKDKEKERRGRKENGKDRESVEDKERWILQKEFERRKKEIEIKYSTTSPLRPSSSSSSSSSSTSLVDARKKRRGDIAPSSQDERDHGGNRDESRDKGRYREGSGTVGRNRGQSSSHFRHDVDKSKNQNQEIHIFKAHHIDRELKQMVNPDSGIYHDNGVERNTSPVSSSSSSSRREDNFIDKQQRGIDQRKMQVNQIEDRKMKSTKDRNREFYHLHSNLENYSPNDKSQQHFQLRQDKNPHGPHQHQVS